MNVSRMPRRWNSIKFCGKIKQWIDWETNFISSQQLFVKFTCNYRRQKAFHCDGILLDYGRTSDFSALKSLHRKSERESNLNQSSEMNGTMNRFVVSSALF